MATMRVEPGFDQDRSLATGASSRLSPDLSKVLVVGQSQINRIVVCKIVERSGLKPVSESPVTAVRVVPLMFPGLVILDGGPDNSDCDAVISSIAALRGVTGTKLPAAILLSTRSGDTASLTLAETIDAVVAKPFTTEQLQPVVERLLAAAQATDPQEAAGNRLR